MCWPIDNGPTHRISSHLISSSTSTPICSAMRSRLRRVRLRFPSLQSSHVGPVDSEDLGEGLLGHTPPLPVGTDVPADLLLEVSFCHIGKPDGLLLEGLQTYE